MNRSQFQSSTSGFYPQNMARHSSTISVEGTPFEPLPTSSYSHHLRSRNLGHGSHYLEERPNLVISSQRHIKESYLTVPRSNMEKHANRIVAKLEENPELMEDTPVSEELRKEALRDLPQNLTMKRFVKTKLTKSVSQKSKRKPIGVWKRFKYSINLNFKKFISNVKHFNYFQIWHGSLKDIEGRFGSGYASYFKFLRWLFVLNFVVALFTLVFLIVPQIIHDTSQPNQNKSFSITNIVIGDGYFVDTVLYYGHYTNRTIELIPHFTFDVPTAYFSLIVILYLVSFIVLAVSVAESYRRTFIETEGGLQNVYANRIFCGWDYAIATKEAAQLKSLSIYNELKELLSEEYKMSVERSCLFNFWTYTIQVTVNVLVLAIIGGVGWLTWTLMKQFFDETEQKVDSWAALTAVVVNIFIMVFPTIFNYISRYEDYKNPRTALYITLVRTYLLGAVIIGVILGFWLTRSPVAECWENLLAAEIYRLIFYDFIFSVILSTLFDIGYFIGRYFFNQKPKSEFNVAKHTLQIIYNQGLYWVGFFYSPILALIVTVKMFIIWYVREISLRNFCKPPKKTWRAAQAQTWFMMMSFVSILLIIAVHGYSLKSIAPSKNCGPFRNYNYTFEILTNSIEHLEENEIWRVIMNVTKPGGVAFIIIALTILVYYVRQQALANRDKVKMLKETLIWMTKDKKFLVQLYNKVTQGELDPCVGDIRFLDPSKLLPEDYIEECSSSGSEDEINARFKRYT